MSNPLPYRHVLGQHRDLGKDLDPSCVRNAFDRGDVAEVTGELGVAFDQVQGLVAESSDSLLQMPNVDLDIVPQDGVCLVKVPEIRLKRGL